MIEFALAHVGLGVRSTDHVVRGDQAAPSDWRVQAVRREFAACQSGFATVHGNDLNGLSLGAAKWI